MKRQVSVLLYLILISGLAACNLPAVPEPAISSDEVALQYETVSAMLTATAARESGEAPRPTGRPQTPSETTAVEPAPTQPDVFTPVSTRVAGEANLKVIDESCDIAQAGRPIDVTIPDDSQFYPGEYFSKTWRLENAGSCTWTRNYAVVWFSGDELGITRTQTFNTSVEPGQVVDVTVDMVAPKQPGIYQSNWKLRSEDGHLFGIGPNGDAPFWVRIIVLSDNTPTVTPTIPVSTPTRAPVILVRESAELLLEEGVDLDLVMETEDLVFQLSEEGELLLATVNGAQLAPFSRVAPRFEDCLLAFVQEESLILDQDLEGSYYCYRTSEGLPGRLLLSRTDFENNQLGLEYTTWAIP